VICLDLDGEIADKRLFVLGRIMLAPRPVAVPSEIQTAEFEFAIQRLREFFEVGDMDALQPSQPHAVYTTAVTIWLLILQRLKGGISLSAAVKDLIADLPTFVPQNKRIQESLLSAKTNSYSDARKRLKNETVLAVLNQMSESIIRQSQRPGQRRKYLLDGTTITLPPTPELKAAFPPATNQHGESVWPLMMVFVAHELTTGCAVKPEIGAMYGNKKDSELKMARKLVTRLASGSIIVADAGLGIFSLAHGAVQAGHDVVLRLSKSRFKSLTKKAQPLFDDTWALAWTPTAKERKTTPELPVDAQVEIRIHRKRLDNGDEIYLATTLLRSQPSEVFDIYNCRQDVETDIGDIKVAMNTENIRAKSKDMVLKELYTSLIAYNAVVQFRRDAARVANKPPRRMSFKGVWDTFESFLRRDLLVLTPEQCTQRYQKALQVASKDIIPDRPGRNYKRQAHPRRPKSTKWQKQQRQEAKQNRDPKEDLNKNTQPAQNSS
jgi:hypothetical protein